MIIDERDIAFLADIHKCIQKIKKYTKNMNFEDFCENDQIIDAVERRFEIIGEASSRISSVTKEMLNNIQWREIKGFRNAIIHDYNMVDYSRMWKPYNIPFLFSKTN